MLRLVGASRSGSGPGRAFLLQVIPPGQSLSDSRLLSNVTIISNRPIVPTANRSCCSLSPMDSAMNRLLLLALGLLITTTSSGCYHYCRHKNGCGDWQQGGCGQEPSCGAGLLPRQARLQHHRPRGRDEVCADDYSECTECGRQHRRRGDDCGMCDDCARQSPRDRRLARRAARRPGRGCDACGGACTGTCGGAASCGPVSACSGAVSYGSCGGCSSCSGGGYPMVGAEGYVSEGGYQPAMGGAPMYGEMISSPPSSGCSGCQGGGQSFSQGGMSYPQGGLMMGSPMMQGGYVMGGSMPSGMVMDGSTGWHSASMPSGPVTSEPISAPAAGTPVYSAPGSTAPAPGSFPTPAK